MKGCRPFTNEELEAISDFFDNEGKDNSIRDKTVLFLCVYTGRRISEIISLRCSDVATEKGDIRESIYFKRSNLKGKKEGFISIINEACSKLLTAYINKYDMIQKMSIEKNACLFPNKNNLILHISRFTANNIFKKIRTELELDGKINTHSCRKTFAKVIYDGTGNDLVSLQNALGHRNISSTCSYVKGQDEKVMSIISNLDFSKR